MLGYKQMTSESHDRKDPTERSFDSLAAIINFHNNPTKHVGAQRLYKPQMCFKHFPLVHFSVICCNTALCHGFTLMLKCFLLSVRLGV